MARPLRHLLLVTTENPFDVKAWSGIPYSLRLALEDHVEHLTVLALPAPKRTPLAVARRILFGAQKYPLWISKPALTENARLVRTALAEHKPDALLSLSSPSILKLQQTAVPMFLFSDAPYLTFAETYARWETFPERLAEFAEEEKELAQRLSGLCFGSAWACIEAKCQYAMSSADADRKLYVTPLGANFQSELVQQAMETHIQNRNMQELHLLFVGRDWERKGGPLSFEIAGLLHAAGQPVHFHVVGCDPKLQADFLTIYGRLNRDNPEERCKLEQLYLNCHFLITPTLAECFGIVFAEAQAFGLPPISRAVDAVPSIVLDGETGLLFPPDAPAQAYAARLQELFRDRPRYVTMALAAYKRFLSTLTWDHCARAITAAINESLN